MHGNNSAPYSAITCVLRSRACRAVGRSPPFRFRCSVLDLVSDLRPVLSINAEIYIFWRKGSERITVITHPERRLQPGPPPVLGELHCSLVVCFPREVLRDRFIWQIVPMMNPDGVVYASPQLHQTCYHSLKLGPVLQTFMRPVFGSIYTDLGDQDLSLTRSPIST